MKKHSMATVGLVGIGLLSLTAFHALRWSSPVAQLSAAVTPRPEQTAFGHVAAEGRVVTYPGAEVLVGADLAGRLVRLLVEEGQTVRKGTLLAETDFDEIRAAFEEATARVAEMQAELRLAELNLSRRRDLVRQEVLPRHNLDEALRDMDLARARLETAQAEVSRHEALLEKTRIRAPISGTVVERHADAGEILGEGDPIVSLADLTRLRIEVEADEADASLLRVGAPVTITAEGWPGKAWRGRLTEIGDSVTLRRLKSRDPGRPSDIRVIRAKVAFEEETPLKLGTTVELRIEARGVK
ncbi:MAG: efflux RND transporter periplasmic adaptor subunit [Acidobacteriota bacterium]